MNIDSQVNQIYRHLKKYKRGLTGMDALIKFGCFRLPARIADIEKKYAVIVERVWVDVVDDDGSKKRVKRYYLTEKE